MSERQDELQFVDSAQDSAGEVRYGNLLAGLNISGERRRYAHDIGAP